MSCPRSRSRSGSAATRDSSSPTSSAWRPRARSASTCSSSAGRRSSSSRAISGLRERLVGDVRERGAPPEPERLPERHRRKLRRAFGELLAALAEQALEQARVDPVGLDVEHVAGRAGHEGAPALSERLAELRDADPESGAAAARRLVAPEILEQAVVRDDLVCVEEEEREQRALTPSA